MISSSSASFSAISRSRISIFSRLAFVSGAALMISPSSGRYQSFVWSTFVLTFVLNGRAVRLVYFCSRMGDDISLRSGDTDVKLTERFVIPVTEDKFAAKGFLVLILPLTLSYRSGDLRISSIRLAWLRTTAIDFRRISDFLYSSISWAGTSSFSIWFRVLTNSSYSSGPAFRLCTDPFK